MSVTAVLHREHRQIERVLACLEAAADDARTRDRADRESFGELLELLVSYADAWHHGKEEDVLFPALTRAGMPAQHGPIAVMLHEHGLGRGFIATMRDQLPGAADGDVPALEALTGAARDYVSLLRAHIGKEDGVLFPMAERFLDAEARQEVLDGFAAQLDPDQERAFLARVDALCERWQITDVPVTGRPPCAGG